MTKSQNTKSEQLTEMMKKGDLPHDIYYVICSKNDTAEIVRNWVQTTSCLKPTISYEFPSNLEVKQVLAPVPSYEEWQAKLEENARLKERVSKLEKMQYSYTPEEWNTMLRTLNRTKELLKECRRYIDIWGYTDTHGNALLPQIDEALK